MSSAHLIGRLRREDVLDEARPEGESGDDVHRPHERVTITKNGKPAAVLISTDDLESL